MKYSRIILLSFLLFGLGCADYAKPKNKDKEKVKTGCKPYFDFDEIEHYQIDITEEEAMKLYESKKGFDQKLNDAVNQDIPNTMSRLELLDDLEKNGYKKNVILKNNFDKVNSIFCERKHKESYATACIAIYRDILVFKKSNKTIGVAKICFGCEQNWIIGTSKNTMEFGMSGDYGKLYDLLNKKK
jgi:hypothetical protein